MKEIPRKGRRNYGHDNFLACTYAHPDFGGDCNHGVDNDLVCGRSIGLWNLRRLWHAVSAADDHLHCRFAGVDSVYPAYRHEVF